MQGPEIAIRSFTFLGALICLSIVLVKFFVIRARSAERHALIERGMDLQAHLPTVADIRLLSRIRWMRLAFLVIGLGLGALSGGFMNALFLRVFHLGRVFPAVFTNLIFTVIGGGLAIILFYRVEPDYFEPAGHTAEHGPE